MFMDVFHKVNGYLGTRYVCHGCGRKSKPRKDGKLPNNWDSISETKYGKNCRPIRSTYSINYYCSHCHNLGMTSEIVALVSRKVLKGK